MPLLRRTGNIVALLILSIVLSQCVSTRDQPKVVSESPAPTRFQSSGATAEDLGEQVRSSLEEGLRQYAQKLARGEIDTGESATSPPIPGAPIPVVTELVKDLRARIQSALRVRIEQDLGVAAPAQTETIALEAFDRRGRRVEVPVPVETRELRSLVLPDNRARVRSLVGTEDLTLTMYDQFPGPLVPSDSRGFMRVYTGEAAAAIAMEAKLIVTLKGGAWTESTGAGRVVNTIAVRGLDLDKGLQTNGNKTYDDTMFVIMETGIGEFEVYEYRMTTESSSDKPGVGRLASKQVTYVRGLHRRTDPGYRLKSGAAEGTRNEMEGEFEIVGANVHSAYAKKPITSDTPLNPNVSLGCQVVASGKSDFEKSLVFLLDKKNVKEFNYTIVNDDEMGLLDASLQERGRRSVLVRGISRGA